MQCFNLIKEYMLSLVGNCINSRENT